MDERTERISLNEALFREVNERVKAITDKLGDTLPAAEFVCECGDRTCTERVRMTLPDYEELRADPTHFVIRPGHEAPDIERVVVRLAGYEIVAKRPGTPTQIAEATDPRG
jgi:hypothetical protein